MEKSRWFKITLNKIECGITTCEKSSEPETVIFIADIFNFQPIGEQLLELLKHKYGKNNIKEIAPFIYELNNGLTLGSLYDIVAAVVEQVEYLE